MTSARYVNPARSVEPLRLTIGKINLRIMLAQPSHQSLGSIANDEKRYVLLVNQIPPVAAHLKGKRRGARRG